ncbi:hypothetical protein [Methylobacterium sp. MA0201]|uniref:hypothetical protein n=1 Tax=Methylobacterium alsaeris TaxID=3344826 RepID=UPI0037567902
MTDGTIVSFGPFRFGGRTYFSGGVDLASAGSNRDTALALTLDDNFVTTVDAGTGVALAAFRPGYGTTYQRQRVVNRGAHALLVYPPSGARIERGATEAAVSIPPGGQGTFACITAVQCWQMP